MTPEDSTQLLRVFFEKQSAPAKAIGLLKTGVEIGVVVADSMELALFQEQGQPQLVQRSAKNPDVIFYLKPEAIEMICKKEFSDVGSLGIQIVKQIMTGSIRLTVPGSMMRIFRNGYIDIIKLGGKTFFDFLAENGLKTLSKIPDLIRSLKPK